MGHGALMYSQDKFEFGRDEFDVVVTGPRRSMFNLEAGTLLSNVKHQAASLQNLRPYFAVPFGDMMIAGCFGLLAATAEIMPNLAETINRSLRANPGQSRRRSAAPWDNPA